MILGLCVCISLVCGSAVAGACQASDAYCQCSGGTSDSALAGYVIENNAKVRAGQCQDWCWTVGTSWEYRCNWKPCAACMGKKEEEMGCCFTITTTTTKSPEELSAADARKNHKSGLICGDKPCRDAFKTGVSWHYNYNLNVVDDEIVQWMNDNEIEWVPMSDRPVEWRTSAGRACTWVKPKGGWSPKEMCDVRTIVDTVNLTNNQLSLKSKAKYLMLFNEAYLDCDSSQCAASTIDPPDVVDVWRRFFIPAARALGLDLVSPTFKGDEPKYQNWTAHVLAQCFIHRNAPDFPCDVRSLKKLSVHAYQCSEQFYSDYYTRNGRHSWTNDLMTRLKAILGSDYINSYFKDFFDETPVWLTEFSCAADGNYAEYPNGFADPFPYGQAPYDEQCRRASGQVRESHGEGVIKTLTDMDEMERFAWYGLVVAADAGDTYVGTGNAVITGDGVVMPPGKLYTTSYRDLASMNCSIPSGVDTSGDGHGGTDNPDKGR